MTVDGQVTGEIAPRRRSSEFFVPVARPKKASQAQLTLDAFGPVKQQPNEIVNEIRQSVARWRTQQYPHITRPRGPAGPLAIRRPRTAPVLLPDRGAGDGDLPDRGGREGRRRLDRERQLRRRQRTHNPGLPRIAFKMATGSGKTVVMAMLIAWQALNKLANPQDRRFSDTFLIVTPASRSATGCACCCRTTRTTTTGSATSCRRTSSSASGRAKIVITNFHAFQRREKVEAAEADQGDPRRRRRPSVHRDARPDGPPRLPRASATEANIVVINDEAHHCYRRKPDGERRRALDRRRAAPRPRSATRRPASGSPASRRSSDKIGVQASTTCRRRPSSCGLRLPGGDALPLGRLRLLADRRHRGRHRQDPPRAGRRRRDDRRAADLPRPLARASARTCPKKGTQDRRRSTASPKLPSSSKAHSRASTATTTKSYRALGAASAGDGPTPPVFIVVCNNTNVSKLVFDYDRRLGEDAARRLDASPVPGKLALFTQRARTARWLRPPEHASWSTSEQLESGEAMSPSSRRSPPARSTSSRPSTAPASPAATPTTSPTKTCSAR